MIYHCNLFSDPWLSHSLHRIVSGSFFLYESMQPSASLYSSNAVDWGLTRMVFTAALNIILAVLITGRLLFLRRSLLRALGTSQALSVPYISIAAMVVESSVLCAFSSLAVAIPYALNSHATNIFLPSSVLMPVSSGLSQTFCCSVDASHFRSFPLPSSICESHHVVLGTHGP